MARHCGRSSAPSSSARKVPLTDVTFGLLGMIPPYHTISENIYLKLPLCATLQMDKCLSSVAFTEAKSRFMSGSLQSIWDDLRQSDTTLTQNWLNLGYLKISKP